MSQQSFADLGVSSAVCASLTERGFTAPFAIQQKVIGDVLAGRDVLAKSPTGSGKTLAFMVPIVDRIEATDRRPAALILAPTRELATQIVEASYPLAHPNQCLELSIEPWIMARVGVFWHVIRDSGRVTSRCRLRTIGSGDVLPVAAGSSAGQRGPERGAPA